MDAIVGVFGVTALQYTALSVLDRHPGMSGAQLARRSFVSAQAGSEMVAVLERKGLIARSPHETNRRILCINLTRAGRDLLVTCNQAIDVFERRMLDGLSGRERDRLEVALLSCIDALSRSNGHTSGSNGGPRSSAGRLRGTPPARPHARRSSQLGQKGQGAAAGGS